MFRLYSLEYLSVPISTYVLGPTQTTHLQYYEDKDGCDLCENVTYLGMSVVWLHCIVLHLWMMKLKVTVFVLNYLPSLFQITKLKQSPASGNYNTT